MAVLRIFQVGGGSLPAASFAWRAFFAPGMGTAPLQIVQLMATYRYEAEQWTQIPPVSSTNEPL